MSPVDEFKGLPRVWEKNIPYPEVLTGALPEDVFAADLKLVRDKGAPPIYQDPQEFFEKTHMTRALESLIINITKKLNGTSPDADSIYKLETSFGGGKTHCLIALFHVFTQGNSVKTIQEILGGDQPPIKTKVVCLDGTEYNCEKGNSRESGITVRTLWGDLAYQLNGKVGYELIRDNDEKRINPGAELLGTLIGDEPVLILMDELALYYEKASGITVGSSSLERQTNTFLYDLLRAVSIKSNAVVVLTLASSQDAFSKWLGTINQAIADAHSIVARKAKVLFPTQEDEMYSVIRRRLFSSWDKSVVDQVTKAYIKLYTKYAEIPDNYKNPDYQEKLRKSYPFHPELLNILETRVSTIANFQKTRGALRLLARVIKDVWTKKESDLYFILPGSVSLVNELVRNELTGRIGKDGLIHVIHADICNDSGDAKSQEIDKTYIQRSLPPIATRIAYCIYLNSLTFGEVKGRDKNTILVGTLTPGMNPDVYLSLIDKMANEYWYLKGLKTGRYFFDSQPTIAKILQDYMKLVDGGEIRGQIRAVMERLFKGSHFVLYIQPNGPSDVKDDIELKLIIMDYENVNIRSKTDTIPKVIHQIWNYEKDNKPRVNKNTLFFMVAAKNLIERLKDVAKEYLAYKKMEDHPEDLKSLSDSQREELEGYIKQSEQELLISAANVYRFLIFPQKNDLTCVEFDPKVIGGTKNRQEIIIEHLSEEGKYKPKISPQYVANKAWSSHISEVTTETFRNWFYQLFSLPIPEKLEVLRKTIKQGVADKIWVLSVGTKNYVSGEKISNIPFSKDAILYRIERAIELDLCDKDGKKCPNCKDWPCKCVKLEPKPEPSLKPKPVPIPIAAKKKKFIWGDTGLIKLLLPSYQQKIEEEKPKKLEKLVISVKNLLGAQALNTLLVHLPTAKETVVDMNINNPDSGQSLRKFKLNFAGQPNQFSQLLTTLKSYIERNKLIPEIRITLNFENSGFDYINPFLKNLKNYDQIEFTLRINGMIE